MKIRILAVAMVGTLLVAGCAADQGGKETAGTLLGAVGGAVLGAQVGKGKGQLVGVALGTLAGAYIGGQIGRSMDQTDKLMAQRTTQTALETTTSGTTSAWSNPDSGYSGTVTPTRTYQAANDRPCREYRTTISIDGKSEEAVGTACREPDGTWRIIN